MSTEEVRGLCFTASTGETVRVHDAICWRHLEGRPCRSAQDRQTADSVDVIIIPVIPSGSAAAKRARRGGQAAPPVAADAPPTGAGEGSTTTSVAASDNGRDTLLHWCAEAQAVLTSGGLRAAVDACPRQTPGAKYHVWENRGVGLRVEVGRREAASATFSLALHPSLVHLLPLAARAAAADQADAWNAGGAAAEPPAESDSRGGGASGRARLRLGNLGPDALVAACLAVLRARDAPSLGTDLATEATPAPAPGTCAAPAGSRTGSRWCGKLHLWPDVLAAWGTTEAAVAALREHLAATATAAAAVTAAFAGGLLSGSGDGEGDGSGSALACTGGGTSRGQRPCVSHLRHLLQLGRPCYCGRGHYSLQELQREVESRYCESRTGADSGHPKQLQPQSEASRVTWVKAQPPTLPAPALQQQLAAATATTTTAAAAKGQLRTPQGQRSVSGDSGVDGDDGDGGGGEGDGDDDGIDHGGAGRVVLLVGDIREGLRAAAVQGELAATFARFGCLLGVQVPRTRNGGHHGWARVLLAGSAADEAAAAAVAALDGKLRLGGASVTVSYSCGRLDTIFPYLPYIVRSALRVDSTAAYSATDQATAARMTDLLGTLAERLMLPPAAAAAAAAPPPAGPLLPLTVTDATACCGGNALSFARRFRRVVAVELDPDRADDLRHNAALVRVWEAFRDGAAPCGAAPPCGTAGSSGPPAAASAGSPAGSPAESDVAAAPPPQQQPPAAAPGGVGGRGLLGSLEVLCGDYTGLMESLQQDIVFMDPPWGGPQYGSATRAVRPPVSGAAGGCPTGLQQPPTASPPQPPGSAAVKASMVYGDNAFMLGCKPLSYMVSELLAGGAAGMVALKLPTRAVAELRAMQSRVRQLVMQKLWEGGVASTGHPDGRYGGNGSGCDSDGDGDDDNGDDDDDTGAPQVGRCCPRLLGAEVTLGRSALVVFMLLPYKRGGCTACGAGASADAGGRAHADADAVRKWRDAGGGGVTDEGSGKGRGAGVGGQASTAEQALGDDAGSRRAGSKPGGGYGNSDGGGDVAAQQRRREGAGAAASQMGCAACAGLAPAFRAALKECCMPYGLPYRFVCE